MHACVRQPAKVLCCGDSCDWAPTLIVYQGQWRAPESNIRGYSVKKFFSALRRGGGGRGEKMIFWYRGKLIILDGAKVSYWNQLSESVLVLKIGSKLVEIQRYGELWGIMGNYGELWGKALIGREWRGNSKLWMVQTFCIWKGFTSRSSFSKSDENSWSWSDMGNYGELWGIMGNLGNLGNFCNSCPIHTQIGQWIVLSMDRWMVQSALKKLFYSKSYIQFTRL